MSLVPPPQVLSAMNAGTGEIVRRLEIFEQDGVTPWLFDSPDTRFNGGQVSVDYGRDERRSLDLTLANIDGALRPNPYGGLWYDKVFKIYRGISYRTTEQPKIVIIEEATTNAAYGLRQALAGLGFVNVDVNLAATKFEDVAGYDVIISYRQTANMLKENILKDAYAAGRSVISNATSVAANEFPFVTSVVGSGGSTTWGADPVTYDTPLASTWGSHSSGSWPGFVITGVDPSATVVGTWTTTGGTPFYSAIIASNQSGGKWFHYSPFTIAGNTEALKLWKDVINWFSNYGAEVIWETQIGEYLIDNMTEANFPHQLRITGRDYTKRPLNSKLTKATSFDAGEAGDDIIKAVAANAGIRKMKIPDLEFTLPTRLDYAPETPRWQIMKEIANSFNYDIFFDMQGYLVVKEFQDPVFSTTTATFQTGPDVGNLVRYERSITDSQLYNHIVITSEATSDNELPFFGEAKNTLASSPTSIDAIGDRPYFWSSAALESDAACVTLAKSWLKIYALESYDISADAICYPWLDVGDIADILEPDRLESDPTRYLLSTVNIPMSLGPMSAQGRRLTIVQG